MLFFHVSGHGFELVSKLAVLKQRIKTYCIQPAVQYYLQPGRKGNITNLQTELAKLQQFQRDIDKVLGGGASVEPGSMTAQVSSNETCFKDIRQTISTGVLLLLLLCCLFLPTKLHYSIIQYILSRQLFYFSYFFSHVLLLLLIFLFLLLLVYLLLLLL